MNFSDSSKKTMHEALDEMLNNLETRQGIIEIHVEMLVGPGIHARECTNYVSMRELCEDSTGEWSVESDFDNGLDESWLAGTNDKWARAKVGWQLISLWAQEQNKIDGDLVQVAEILDEWRRELLPKA